MLMTPPSELSALDFQKYGPFAVEDDTKPQAFSAAER